MVRAAAGKGHGHIGRVGSQFAGEVDQAAASGTFSVAFIVHALGDLRHHPVAQPGGKTSAGQGVAKAAQCRT